jgi:3-hydroxyacyl-CoA dehydrogenase/enoyl-CoA hydratase/3-hydroxybutyryl-CoA epimerase
MAVDGPAELSEIGQRLILRLLLEAARCLHERIVAEAWMVDLGMSLGTGYPSWRGGPLQTIRDWGPKNVEAGLLRLAHDYGPRFTAPDGVFDSCKS